MGRRFSGKSTMRSIIFADRHAKDTAKFAFTMEFENSKVKFLGNLYLNLWECRKYSFVNDPWGIVRTCSRIHAWGRYVNTSSRTRRS